MTQFDLSQVRLTDEEIFKAKVEAYGYKVSEVKPDDYDFAANEDDRVVVAAQLRKVAEWLEGYANALNPKVRPDGTSDVFSRTAEQYAIRSVYKALASELRAAMEE